MLPSTPVVKSMPKTRAPIVINRIFAIVLMVSLLHLPSCSVQGLLVWCSPPGLLDNPDWARCKEMICRLKGICYEYTDMPRQAIKVFAGLSRNMSHICDNFVVESRSQQRRAQYATVGGRLQKLRPITHIKAG